MGSASSSLAEAASIGSRPIIQHITNFPMDSSGTDEVVLSLESNQDRILAIYLLSQSIPVIANGKFHHWMVKMHTGSCILSLEIGEYEEKGFISLKGMQKLAPNEARECFYSSNDNNEETEILASVVPTLTTKGKDYVLKCSQHMETAEETMEKMLPFWLHKIYEELISSKEDKYSQLGKYFTLVPIEKRICDVAGFISDWTNQHQNYNPIYSNCQRFAFDLFEFLSPVQFQSQLGTVQKKFECPYDSGKEQRKSKNPSLKKQDSFGDDVWEETSQSRNTDHSNAVSNKSHSKIKQKKSGGEKYDTNKSDSNEITDGSDNESTLLRNKNVENHKKHRREKGNQHQ